MHEVKKHVKSLERLNVLPMEWYGNLENELPAQMPSSSFEGDSDSLMNFKIKLVICPKNTFTIAFRCTASGAAFTPRQSASSVERLANQRLHLGRDEVSDWLDSQCSTLTALV
ncbi:hypothetical protein TNCV_219391 [Trichonephila clavipes]|nr:hypothetical protein TNCV_219391 [Trichonephila clavipes]